MNSESMTSSPQSESAESSKQAAHLLVEARTAFEQEQLVEASNLLEEALQCTPQHRLVRTLLAMAYAKRELFKEAENLYLELIQEDESELTPCLNLAMMYLSQQHPPQALTLLKHAVAHFPKDLRIHSALGLVYARTKDYERAAEHFEKAEQKEMARRVRLKFQALRAATPMKPSTGGGTDEYTIFSQNNLASEYSLQLSAEPGFSSNMQSRHIFMSPVEEDNRSGSLSIEQTSGIKTFPIEPNANSESWTVAESSENSASSSAVPTQPVVNKKYQNISKSTATPSVKKEEISAQTELMDTDVSFALKKKATAVPSLANLDGLDGLSEYDFSRLGEVLGVTHLWWKPTQKRLRSPFWFREKNLLEIHCTSKIYSRIRSVISILGDVHIVPECKRFRGEELAERFGPRSNPLVRIEGEGVLRFALEKKSDLTRLYLKPPLVAYFCEGVVMAFEPNIFWENGRLPSVVENFSDLALDNFWGEGEILLSSKGPVRLFHVSVGERVRVSYDKLIGWVGVLIPKMVCVQGLFSEDEADPRFVDFYGQGGIFVSPF
ncbi:MAG: tetratricopeptide repeat protein [Myxococcota bacterium]